jgi:hypothetical protein
MNQKTVPAIAIMVMLWAADATCGSGACARQSVTLEVVPAVEAAVFLTRVEPVEPGADAAPARRAEWRNASLVVTPITFRGKVTASLGSHGLTEVDVKPAGDADLTGKPLRFTLTDL